MYQKVNLALEVFGFGSVRHWRYQIPKSWHWNLGDEINFHKTRQNLFITPFSLSLVWSSQNSGGNGQRS